MKEIPPKTYKIALIGVSGIWTNASLFKRLIDDSFNINSLSTIGVDGKRKFINLKSGKQIELFIYYTEHQERYL